MSLGIEKLITSIDDFCMIKRGQGLAKIRLEEIRNVGLNVEQEIEPEWREFANAHAIVTGYVGWTNKQKEEAARALRNAANAWGVIRLPDR
jgi:hypothetical protein